MGPSFEVRCYNRCIVGELRFHTSECDSWRTTQISEVMVIGESDANGSGDNNFYDVRDECCTSNIRLEEDPVILATQAHQVFYLDNLKNGSNWKVVQVVQNKRKWNVPKVDYIENEQRNVLPIVVGHRVDENIEDDTMCRTDVDPTIVERPVVRHVNNEAMRMNNCHIKAEQVTTNDNDESFPSDFDEIDVMFLKFVEDLDNPVGGSLSVGKNSGTAQPFVTTTIRTRAQSRLLELEHYVCANRMILMSIALGVEKPILQHVVSFNQAIGVCARKIFPVHCLKWADVGREYIEVVEGDLQHFFMLYFKDQAMNRLQRMRIIKCWNSNPSLPQSVLSHSLRTSYARVYWVNDRATQKALVGDPSPSLARRPVQAVPRPCVCNSW
ncbi:CACTA en-spm transposon protein [Cucumis melo var. makuwa]|uniref:CACTA en-spm transposon protein n=1 Tax=Cucumis melo var. makuwa TaxID=1194695 RepID=A0A5D3CXI8_CUCMM|nr:CACTA en-spm transposon protein [Cucumis melo var. makuwa]TYK15968.1 CACTA en-spm transposon protein [Cucumis melo var. makuwa]